MLNKDNMCFKFGDGLQKSLDVTNLSFLTLHGDSIRIRTHVVVADVTLPLGLDVCREYQHVLDTYKFIA